MQVPAVTPTGEITMPEDDFIEFAPGVLEKMESDPELKAAMQEMLANMRQAHHAWTSGQYASFDDAMEAITGSRPEAVDVDDLPDEDE
jgi:hypothetical protein